MKILVIGNGFIATPIIQRLESEGHELLIYSRTIRARIHSQQVIGDIFNFEDFLKTLSWKPQIIIHTAWIATAGIYRNDPSNHKYAHFTTDLAAYLTHTDVEHLIILGTCAEYGHQYGPSTAGVTKLSPNILYAQQKVAAFEAAKVFLVGSKIRMTWARIFYPYGPGQDQKRLIPYLIRSLKNGDPILLTDTSSNHDWITTRDIASAISWVIEKEVPLEVDIGTSFGFTNLELLTTLAGLLQKTDQLDHLDFDSIGLTEAFVAGKDSPLFKSGWMSSDSLSVGLQWILDS